MSIRDPFAARVERMRVKLALETQDAMDAKGDGGTLISRQMMGLIAVLADHIISLTERIEALEDI